VKTVTRGTVVLETNTYDADGNKILAVDAEGRKTQFVYDFANRLIERMDGYESAEAATTTFRVDANGNVTGEQDGRTRAMGGDWSIQREFDALNRVTDVTDGERHTTHFGYDAEGNRILVRQPMGQETSYAYDELGKLLSVTQPQGTTA